MKELVSTLYKEYAVGEIGSFGFFSEKSNTKDSNIDILVELVKPISWKIFSLKISKKDFEPKKQRRGSNPKYENPKNYIMGVLPSLAQMKNFALDVILRAVLIKKFTLGIIPKVVLMKEFV